MKVIPIEVWERCELIASQHAAHFAESSNTVVLTTGHGTGIARGLVAEWFVSEALGVDWLAAGRPPGQDPGYDVLAPDGRRIDVKGTKFGSDLMIPSTQAYKLDRVDVIVLVWIKGQEAGIRGWITPREFRERHLVGETPIFRVRTMYVPADELREWPL